MKTIKDIILGRKDPGNLHAWAKTNEDHSIDLGIWYNGKWNFIGSSSEGGGGAGGDYPSDEQVIHIVADATYTGVESYLDPQINESEKPTLPSYEEISTLINKYKGQVFIDYTVRITNSSEGVREFRFLLRYASLREDIFSSILFIGPDDVYIGVMPRGILCSTIQMYPGYFECSVNKVDGVYVASFSDTISADSFSLALELENTLRCVITDVTDGSTLYVNLAKHNDMTFVFSNHYAELTVTFVQSAGDKYSTSFKYFEEQTPDPGPA